MAHESRSASDVRANLALEIEIELGGVLDDFRMVQDSFFGSCRRFVSDSPSTNYEEMEQTAFAVEFSLDATARAIFNSQRSRISGLRMAHGFLTADDRMRAELFHELVPAYALQAYGDMPDSSQIDREFPANLRHYSGNEVLSMIITSAVNYLHSDMATFIQALAAA